MATFEWKTKNMSFLPRPDGSTSLRGNPFLGGRDLTLYYFNKMGAELIQKARTLTSIGKIKKAT
jgi:hypothetical protein